MVINLNGNVTEEEQTLKNAVVGGLSPAGQIQAECTAYLLQKVEIESTCRFQEQIQTGLNFTPLGILGRKKSHRSPLWQGLGHNWGFTEWQIHSKIPVYP